MSLGVEFQVLVNNLTDAYDALSSKGATMPENKNTDSLTDTINSVPSGIDTSDATAGVGDIVEGKTAYVDGQKITGTLGQISGGESVNVEEISYDSDANSVDYTIDSRRVFDSNAKVVR